MQAIGHVTCLQKQGVYVDVYSVVMVQNQRAQNISFGGSYVIAVQYIQPALKGRTHCQLVRPIPHNSDTLLVRRKKRGKRGHI